MLSTLRIAMLSPQWARTGEALDLDGDTRISLEWVSPLLEMRPSYSYDFTVPATPLNLRLLGDPDLAPTAWAEGAWRVAIDGLPFPMEGHLRCTDFGEGRISLSFRGVNRFWATADALPLRKVVMFDGTEPRPDDRYRYRRVRKLYPEKEIITHPVAIAAGQFLEACVAACGATLRGHARIPWLWLDSPEGVFLVPEDWRSDWGRFNLSLPGIERPVGEWLRALCAQLGVRLWVEGTDARLISLDASAPASPPLWLGRMGYTRRVPTALGGPLRRLAPERRGMDEPEGALPVLQPMRMRSGHSNPQSQRVDLMQPALWPGLAVGGEIRAVDVYHVLQGKEFPRVHPSGEPEHLYFKREAYRDVMEGRGESGREYMIGGEVFALVRDGQRLVWEHRASQAPWIYQGEGERIASPFWRGCRRWLRPNTYPEKLPLQFEVGVVSLIDNTVPPKPKPPEAEPDPDFTGVPSRLWLPEPGQRLLRWETLPVARPGLGPGNRKRLAGPMVPYLHLAVEGTLCDDYAILHEDKPEAEPRIFLRRFSPARPRQWAEGQIYEVDGTVRKWHRYKGEQLPGPEAPPEDDYTFNPFDKCEYNRKLVDWKNEPQDAMGVPYEPERGTGYPPGLVGWLWWHRYALQGPLQAWDDYEVLRHLYDDPRPEGGEVPSQRIARMSLTIGPETLTVDRVEVVQWWALAREHMKAFFEATFRHGEPPRSPSNP